MTRPFHQFLGCVLTATFVLAGTALDSAAQQKPSRRELQKGANSYDEKHEITVDGGKRSYLLYVPHPVAKGHPLPLLLVFHGGGGHDYNMPRFTGFDRIAQARGFLVAYPESMNGHWNDGRNLSSADDIGFVKALIVEVERSHSVDPTRIYATGISNGGFFSQRVACDLADRVSAVASVAATIPEPLVPVCHPSKPVSVMFLQGTKDPLVHIDGGAVAGTHGRNISLDDAVRYWREHDRARSKPESSDLPHHDSNGTSVHRDIYGGGEDGSEVVMYTIQDGGHTWPGGEQYLPALLVGKVNHDIDASEVIWEFFSRHSR